MIKNAYVDPLQESMEIKMYNERYAAIAPSKFNIGLEGAYMHAAQIEQAYNALMEQVGIAELRYYSETGYTLSQGYYIEAEAEAKEAKKGNIKDNIKDAAKAASGKAKSTINKLVEKAIELFKKIKDMLAAAFKKAKEAIAKFDIENKAFVAKYSILLKNYKNKEITLNTYAFPGLQADSPGPNFIDAVNKIKDNNGSEESMWAAIGKFRSELVPGTNITGTGEEFIAAARKAIYGDKSETSQSVGAAIIFIKNNKKIIDNLNKQYANADKTITNMIKELEKEKDDKMNTASPVPEGEFTVIKNRITLYKQAASDMQAYCQLRSKALIDRLRYSKAICVKALMSNKVGDAKEVFGKKVEEDPADKTKKVKAAVGRIGESASIEDIFNLQFT